MPSPTGNGNPHFVTFKHTVASESSESFDDAGSNSDSSENARLDRLLSVTTRRSRRGSKKNSDELSSGLQTPVISQLSRESSFEEPSKEDEEVEVPEVTEVEELQDTKEEVEATIDGNEAAEEVAQDGETKSAGNSDNSRTNSFFPFGKIKPRRNILGRSIYEQLIWTLDNDPTWQAHKAQNRTIGFYKIYGELGAGNFAKVKLGVHQLTKEKVAVKIIDKTRVEARFEKMLSREVACMDALTHPHLIRLFEVLETPGQIYLISEYAPGGDLYTKVTLVGRLCEVEANNYYRQVLSAVHYMLADFGFSTVARRGQLLTTFCGSPPYAAPELFTDGSYEGPPVDVWALGILLYFMLNGVVPFHGNCISSLKKSILEGKYAVEDHMSKASLDLLELILKQIPCKRPTVSAIIRHRWVRSGLDPRPLTTRSSSSSSIKSTASNPYHKPKLLKQDSNLVFVRRESTNLVLPFNQASVKSLPTCEQAMNGDLSDPEMQALQIMNEIGIDDAFMDMHRPRGVRSPIIGIYRIILHRIIEGRMWSAKDFVLPCSSGTSSSSQNIFFLTKTLLKGKARNSVRDQDESGMKSNMEDKKSANSDKGSKSKACNVL